MKKYFLFIAVFFLITNLAWSDVYIKESFVTEAQHGKISSNKTGQVVSEYWVGNNKITSLSKNRQIILDMSKNLIYFVLTNNKSYVEAPLDSEYSKLLANDVLNMLQKVQFRMTAKATGEMKKINSRNCKVYEIENWTIEDGQRKGNVKRTIWVTKDVPFDLNLYWSVATSMVKLVNSEKNFLKEFEKTKGFPFYSESSREVDGVMMKSRQQVVEISQKTPPKGIYSPPPQFTQNKVLNMYDMMFLFKD